MKPRFGRARLLLYSSASGPFMETASPPRLRLSANCVAVPKDHLLWREEVWVDVFRVGMPNPKTEAVNVVLESLAWVVLPSTRELQATARALGHTSRHRTTTVTCFYFCVFFSS